MKRMISILLCALVFFALSVSAFADCGPKPSLRVTLKGSQGEHFYATLISEESKLPPMHIKTELTDEDYAQAENDPEAAAFVKFAEYSDGDDFVFFGNVWDSEKTRTIHMGYYPPDVFKVLVWYPDSDSMISTGEYNCYAFSSYFTVDLDNIDSFDIKAAPSYEYIREGIALLLRMALTIAVELLVAIAFGYRGKKAMLFLAAINAMTQILLNIVLSVETFRNGFTGFFIAYIPMELIVFTIELIIYIFNLGKYDKYSGRTGKIVAYTMTANFLSLLLGFIIQFVTEMGWSTL